MRKRLKEPDRRLPEDTGASASVVVLPSRGADRWGIKRFIGDNLDVRVSTCPRGPRPGGR